MDGPGADFIVFENSFGFADLSRQVCSDAGGPTSDGFDLDAVSIVHAEMP